MKILSIAE